MFLIQGGGKGSEGLMKKIKKVLKPQQKMNDETVSRNCAAVSREPEKLYHLTPELDLQASYALGHNDSKILNEKVEAPDVAESESILGAIEEADDVWNPAEYAQADVIDGDDEEGEDQEAGEAAQQAAGQSTRGQLVVGSIVTAKHARWGDDCFHAEVRAVPEPGATGAGSHSCTLRWLDEVGGEGSGVFEYESRKPWDKEESIALAKVQDTAAQLHPRVGPTGQTQWLTDEALAVSISSASSVSASTSATTTAASAASAASTCASTEPGTAVSNPIDLDPEKIILRKSKQNKQQMISSSPLLSSSPTEWLNDAHINGITSLSALPTAHRIRFNAARGANVETVLTSKTFMRALTNSLATPLAALVQNYVSELHWRKLIPCFFEKVLYYYEPYGSRLRAGHAIIRAYDRELGALDDGWQFKSIEVKVQTDSCSCGPWDLVVDRAFVAYVDSSDFGTCSFDVFLRTWLGQLQPQPVVDLFMVTNSGTQRIAAIEGNLAFIREERIRIRALLLAAARAGKLSDDGALLSDFVAEGRKAASAAELDARDEQDEESEGGAASAADLNG